MVKRECFHAILDVARSLLDIPISFSNTFGAGRMSEAFLGSCGFLSSIIACYLVWENNKSWLNYKKVVNFQIYFKIISYFDYLILDENVKINWQCFINLVFKGWKIERIKINIFLKIYYHNFFKLARFYFFVESYWHYYEYSDFNYE